MKPEHRAQALEEVVRRVMREQSVRREKDPLFTPEVLINDTLFHEERRLAAERPSPRNRAQKKFWADVASRFHREPESEQLRILETVTENFAREIMGGFNEKVYRFATRVVPFGFKALFSHLSAVSLLTGVSSRLNLEDVLTISGHVNTARSLAERATLIMTPTHVSNLDSIIIGMALHQCRLPPFTYGAGLNLFSNPIVSYFMHNLGAYKVDRSKKNDLYKDTLKHYANLSLELGYHNLFFPGGTRNRRGDIERYLKLGLLGCGLSAFIHNLQANKSKPGIFVIPVTISEGLVLEASPLITDYLKHTGKSRYIIDRKGIGTVQILRFIRNLKTLNSKIHVRFCEPMDLFGNRVDAEGISRDRHGRPVDISRYVERDGAIVEDLQRDREYTRELGKHITACFKANNIVLPTHICAYALFHLLLQRKPDYDFYRFLRSDKESAGVPKGELLDGVSRLLGKLRELEAQGRLIVDPALEKADAGQVLEIGMQHFSSYHSYRVVYRNGDDVHSNNLKLLFYYRNRLDHYGLENELQWPVPPA